MGFPYDGTGISADGPTPAPVGNYWCRVEEATDTDKEGLPLRSSKTGAPMVRCKVRIIDENAKWPTFFHYVTFLPKGSPGDGMAVRFLKLIGEPHEGQFEVSPENWVTKMFRAKIKVEADKQGVMRNAIQYLVDETTEKKPDDSEVPF